MADPKIIEYIKTNLDSGRSTDEIKSALRQSGWPEEQISTGFLAVQGSQPSPSLPAEPGKPAGPAVEGKKKGRGKLIIALVVFFLLLFLFLYVAVNIVQDFRTMFPEAGGVIPIDIPFLS